jgi:hypothetical protein
MCYAIPADQRDFPWWGILLIVVVGVFLIVAVGKIFAI